MTGISIVLLVVFGITSVILVLMVLLQNEQGEGLGGLFGGGASSGQIGNRKGNTLTKITSVLGFVFMLSAFGLAFVNRTPEDTALDAQAREAQARQFEDYFNATSTGDALPFEQFGPEADAGAGVGEPDSTGTQP